MTKANYKKIGSYKTVPPEAKELAIKLPLPGNAKAYEMGRCRVIVSQEMGLWHISVSHPKRYPSWDEIKAARYQLIPDDVTMAMILPDPADYVNTHENTLQMWQVDDPRGAFKG